METTYEWDIETVDTVTGDIKDHHHHNRLADLVETLKRRGAAADERYEIVLVRDVGSDSEGVVDRQWWYPLETGTWDDLPVGQIPAKYVDEFAKHEKEIRSLLNPEVTAKPVEVLATLTTRERRRGAWQIWLQGKCFDAVGAVAGDPYDVKMEDGRAEILFHKHGRRAIHQHGSSGRLVIDLTSLAVAKHFGSCTVEVTAGRDAVLAERDGVKTIVITRV